MTSAGVTAKRQQFVIGGPGREGFDTLPMGFATIHAERDLPLAIGPRVAVLGVATHLSGAPIEDVLANLGDRPSLQQALHLQRLLVGRFVIVADTDQGPMVVPDAMASKPVHLDEQSGIMASCDRLLEQIVGLGAPPSRMHRAMLSDPRFDARQSAWSGLRGPATGFRRLLPNRFLHIPTSQIQVSVPEIGRPRSIDHSASLLRRVVRSLQSLGPLDIGLTGGFDSRLLLAAFVAESIPVSTFTFTDGQPRKEADAATAAEVAEAAGVPHRVIAEPEPDLHGITDVLRGTHVRPRTDRHILAQLTHYRDHPSDRVVISGVGGEIPRSKYAHVPPRLSRSVTRRVVLGDDPFTANRVGFDEWWSERFDAVNSSTRRLPPTTWYHWEQRLGIWGSQFMSEKDHFLCEVPGFGSLELLTTLLAFPPGYRSAHRSALFLDLITELSPAIARLPRPVLSRSDRLLRSTPGPELARSFARDLGPWVTRNKQS